MSKVEHIPVLDVVRGCAVLLVCLAHFFQVNEASLYDDYRYIGIILFKLSQIGLQGVEIFFVLSGFLITRILLNNIDNDNYYRNFIIRRIIRIFPLYYFVLFITLIILPNYIHIDNEARLIINNQVYLWTYMSNIVYIISSVDVNWDGSSTFPMFGHFWSLCVEEHFYLMWPVIIMIFRNHLNTSFFVMIFISVLFTLLYLNTNSVPSIFGWSSIGYANYLVSGGAIAYYQKNNTNNKLDKILKKEYLYIISLVYIGQSFIPRSFAYSETISYAISVFYFPILILYMININNIQHNKIYFKILTYVGKISYGIYVYHGLIRPYFKIYIYEPITLFMTDGILSTIVYTIICTLLTIMISHISWISIERPFLSIKKYFV